jgi:hypothetical protein
MRYVSPFQELGIELDSSLGKADLHLAKKRLLAELDLSDGVTILRGSTELTKNDVINQFDKLAAIDDWDFHRLVFKDKGLLNFLQNRDWNAQIAFLKEPKYEDEAFVEFINPYFSRSYKSLILKSISNGNPDILKALLDIPASFLTYHSYNSAWYNIQLFLSNWMRNLSEIAENIKNGQIYTEVEFASFHNQSFMECLNLLPDKLRAGNIYSPNFRKFRDDYAQLIFTISEYFWNQNYYERAIELVENARFLDVSFRIERLLDKRIVWYNQQIEEIKNPPPESADWVMIWRIIMFATFLFFWWLNHYRHR